MKKKNKNKKNYLVITYNNGEIFNSYWNDSTIKKITDAYWKRKDIIINIIKIKE